MERKTEERKRGSKEEKTRARGRKFRSKTTHDPFLRWTEQDDAAHYSLRLILSMECGTMITFSYLWRERERDTERILLDPSIHGHHFVSSLFSHIFQRERERERRRATLCFTPSSILSAIKNINSLAPSDRKAQCSLFSRFFFFIAPTFVRRILAEKSDAARLRSPPHPRRNH